MSKLSYLCIKYVPKNYPWILLWSYLFFNGVFWLYEDYAGIDHKLYWYDVVQLMVWIAAGAVLQYLHWYIDVKYDISKNEEGQIVLTRKKDV